MIYIGLLTHQQKQVGFFVTQDEDFIYLWQGKNGHPYIISTFLYEQARVKEIRDSAEKYRQEMPSETNPVKA